MTSSLRCFLGITLFLVASGIQFMSVAFISMEYGLGNDFLLATIIHYSGLAFGAAVFPLALSALYPPRQDSGFWQKAGGFLTQGIILFLPLVVYLLGVITMRNQSTVSYLGLFALGMIVAPVYCFTFNQVPKNLHGLTFGLSLSVGLAVCRLSLPSAGEPLDQSRFEFFSYLQNALVLGLSVLLVILMRRYGKALFLPNPPALEQHRTSNPESRQVLKLLGAICFFYLLNGLLNGILFPTLMDRRPLRFHALDAVVILFCPLFGMFLDKARHHGAKTILLVCSFLFMLSPALSLSYNSGTVYDLILLVETFAQYAFYITVTVLMIRWASGPWFCVLYTAPVFLRTISVASVLFFSGVTHIGMGETVFAALCAGIILYLLVKDIHDHVPAQPLEDGDMTTPLHHIAEEASETEADDAALEPILSPRECEVAALLVMGAATREIAVSLSISENTVKVHVKNILEKYNLPNRKAFIARMIALQERMPPPDLLH